MKAELAAAWPDPARHQHRRSAGKANSASPRVPGRERDLEAAVQAGARLRLSRSAAARSIVSPARCRRSSGRRRSAIFIRNLARAADRGARRKHHLLIEPINPRDRPDYFLTRVEHAADIIAQGRRAQRAHPIRLLSRADRRRRPHPPLREAPAADRPCSDRGGAVAPRAGRGRDRTIPRSSPRSTGSAMRAGSAASTARADAPRTGSAGAGRSGSRPARAGATGCPQSVELGGRNSLVFSPVQRPCGPDR